MKLRKFVEVWKKLRETTSKKEKIQILKETLRKASLPERIALVKILGERVAPSITHLPPPVPVFFKEELTLEELVTTLEGMKKTAKRTEREKIVGELLYRMNREEREFFLHLLSGEPECGVREGMLLEALGEVYGKKKEEMEEIFLREGTLERVILHLEGKGGEVLFSPLKPMLASSLHSFEEIPFLEFYVEYKIDGIRAQVHSDGKRVKIFSRNLRDITGEFPELHSLFTGKGEFILDGEIFIPRITFQELMRKDKEKTHTIRIFDIIYLNGEMLDKRELRERRKMLEALFPELVIPYVLTRKKEDAERFFKQALKEGFEGVMIKDPHSFYIPGRRGSHWLKIKRVYTVDLVVIGAEWGHGRRKKWLSNYYLACWDERKERLVQLGKTFKGLSDEEFEVMTQRLLSMVVKDEGWRVWVQPGVVCEVEFEELQRSPKYDSGYALRFARIKRIREDKEIWEADTIKEVLSVSGFWDRSTGTSSDRKSTSEG
ncbi:hypothetical protein DRQ20_00700 [bacterium]|nr:MAG: hypothetical protein DRQ20_00700 [bacterium]